MSRRQIKYAKSQRRGRKRTNSRKKPKRSLKTGFKLLAKTVKILLVVGLVLLLAAAYHLKSINQMIEDKFDRDRKWNLPSRVFSDAEYLYPGIDIQARQIIAKLDRLGYRDVGSEIAAPGDYSLSENALDVYLHDFEYPQESFKGFPLRLQLRGTIIEQAVNLYSYENLDLIKLEPEMVATIFDERREDRTEVTLNDLPNHLMEAIILIEDERFFQHKGVDPKGIGRAAVANLQAGRIVQGGSTLTQQLVKNFFLYPKKSLGRKLNEALIAFQIERNHSKGEILQAYVNEIYLGQRGATSISGVAEAAKHYFAKKVTQLSLAECAQMAGMIKNPYAYSPYRSKERAKARRDFILKRMLSAELVTTDEYERAVAEAVLAPKHKVRFAKAPYFIDFVKKQLGELYSQEVLQSEGLRIFTTLDVFAQLEAEKSVKDGLQELEKAYAADLPKDHEEQLQACLVSIQPSTGYVRAMVGGRNYSKSQFNRCTQAKRQPGSTFKPFVYLTALDAKRSHKLFTASSLLDDTQFTIESGDEPWTPRNYDEEEHGQVTLRTALEKSYNISTAKLALEVGLENVVKTARDAGIKSPLAAVPSIALGTFELAPLELAAAYTLFPNGGIRAEPIAIMHVVNKASDVLERRKIRMKRKFDSAPVFLTTSLLKGVVERGTAVGAKALGFEGIAAGKTGTTSNYRDAWFVGFTPQLLALTWVGYDDNAETNMSGARAALPLWSFFMQKVAGQSSQDFTGPNNVVLVKVDPITGGLVSRKCPEYIYEAFVEGTEPDYLCESVYIEAKSSFEVF